MESRTETKKPIELFKVGDKVKLKSYERWNDWKDHKDQIATIRNIEYPNGQYSIQIEWKDGCTSSTPKDNLINLSVDFKSKINPKIIKKWKKIMETETKKQISISIERSKGQTYLSFEFAPEIEELWKIHEPQIKESEAWEGLKFYFIPDITDSYEYKCLLSKYQLRDDYGHALFTDELFNIAFIRTVGGKGRIKIKNTTSHAELATNIENTRQFLKEYFQNYLQDFKINCNITINF
jgi:hypothetical protein